MRHKQQQFYKNNLFIIFTSSLILSGCTANKVNPPSVVGKPCIKINQNIPATHSSPSPHFNVKKSSTNSKESL